MGDAGHNAPARSAATRPWSDRTLEADLIAVLVAVSEGEPRVMTVGGADALPSGPFEYGHRSLQAGLRAWVEEQTHHPLGYVEQLYTFADRDRTAESGARGISVSYLGLTREDRSAGGGGGWRSWYEYFPWEDHRDGAPALLAGLVEPLLRSWIAGAPDPAQRAERQARASVDFGLDGRPWNEELVLQRYELLFETGAVPEAARGRTDLPGSFPPGPLLPGRPMLADHRRILATGIARLRAKIKYRPVVFELMPATFTLLRLQRSVEALAGRRVHKGNFRRLMEQQELVEETGATTAEAGGRPAKLFRFRHAVFAERAASGTTLPLSRP